LSTRNYALILLLLAAPALHGCFPVIATGMFAGALVATDRRTSGMILEDEGIELRVAHGINQKYRENSHVNVSSFNRNVLLTGEAANEEMRHDIEAIANAQDNVRSVVNEVVIAGNSSYASRANDSLLSSKVRARFIGEDKFPVTAVKIVTENGVVYLMGLVSTKEGEDAAAIASTTSGVQKVVKVFEFIPAEKITDHVEKPADKTAKPDESADKNK
jgi:osmotically-inducible protein OsmY